MRSLGYTALDFDAMSMPELYERLCIHIDDSRRTDA